jgi:hypothetical protein
MIFGFLGSATSTMRRCPYGQLKLIGEPEQVRPTRDDFGGVGVAYAVVSSGNFFMESGIVGSSKPGTR